LPPSGSSSIIFQSVTSAMTAATPALLRIRSIDASRSSWLLHSSVTQTVLGSPTWRLIR
jgi:hypothetical protein